MSIRPTTSEVDAMLKQCEQVREACVKHAKGKRDVEGRIPCPICKTEKGTHTVSWAACNNPDCIRFME